MTENFRPTVIKNQALAALKGKWTPAVIVALVFYLIVIVASALSGVSKLLYWIVLLGGVPIVGIGMVYVYWDLFMKGSSPEVGKLFAPFEQYIRVLETYLRIAIFTYLWSLLLIIPGIIKGLAYSMSLFILRENPDMTITEVISTSRKMMKGHKMDLFLLSLSFIGWAILSVITLGIGSLWLTPYLQTSYAAFYETLKKEGAL